MIDLNFWFDVSAKEPTKRVEFVAKKSSKSIGISVTLCLTTSYWPLRARVEPSVPTPADIRVHVWPEIMRSVAIKNSGMKSISEGISGLTC